MTIPQADHLRVELDPAVVLTAYARHRRRFGSSAGALDEAGLATPSRCAQWTVADVLRHGCDVDRIIRSIWAGESPIGGFDPRVTPHEWVLEGRSVPDVEVRDRYIESADAMAADVEGSGPERWGLPSLSPAGAVPWWLGVLHVLFDSWVHERDVLMPLGLEVAVVTDEVDVVLAYSLAIVPLVSRVVGTNDPVDAVVCGFRVSAGNGPVTVTRADGDPRVPVLTGDRALVVDALSGRGELEDVLTGDPAVAHLLGALARFFTTPV
ncbi:MAG: hypothetical protein JWP02_1892 [Acidimicrobiales bacterium]|nr:hypothetical protein [Acidimicrobiales bacterium]